MPPTEVVEVVEVKCQYLTSVIRAWTSDQVRCGVFFMRHCLEGVLEPLEGPF